MNCDAASVWLFMEAMTCDGTGDVAGWRVGSYKCNTEWTTCSVSTQVNKVPPLLPPQCRSHKREKGKSMLMPKVGKKKMKGWGRVSLILYAAALLKDSNFTQAINCRRSSEHMLLANMSITFTVRVSERQGTIHPDSAYCKCWPHLFPYKLWWFFAFKFRICSAARVHTEPKACLERRRDAKSARPITMRQSDLSPGSRFVCD